MFCTQCGMENAANTDVCVACGTPLTPRQTNENFFGGYTADINEKLGRLHGINQRHFLNEAKETKGRIRNKLIVSGVIGVPLLAIWVLELIACAPELLSYLQGETVPEIAAGLMGANKFADVGPLAARHFHRNGVRPRPRRIQERRNRPNRHLRSWPWNRNSSGSCNRRNTRALLPKK